MCFGMTPELLIKSDVTVVYSETCEVFMHQRYDFFFFLFNSCGVSNCDQPDLKILLTYIMISKIYSLIINLEDYCMSLPTSLHHTKLVIYFYKQEDANVNTQAPQGGGSISTLLRLGSDGTSAGQRLTSQHDNIAVWNSTRWKNIWHDFSWVDYFFKRSSLCAVY